MPPSVRQHPPSAGAVEFAMPLARSSEFDHRDVVNEGHRSCCLATLPANQPAIQPGSGIHAVRTALPLARPRTGPDEQQRQPIVTRHVWELPSGTLVEEQWTADSADFADRTTKNTKGTKGECHFVSFVLFVVFRACFSTTDESASIILFGCGRRQRWVISAPNRHRSEAALSRSG